MQCMSPFHDETMTNQWLRIDQSDTAAYIWRHCIRKYLGVNNTKKDNDLHGFIVELNQKISVIGQAF